MHLSQVSFRAEGALGVLQLAAALGPPRRKSPQPESERRRQAAALRGASPGSDDPASFIRTGDRAHPDQPRGRKAEKLALIEFSKEEKETIVGQIRRYFREELDREIGRFEAEFLLEFFAKEIGCYYYNRGLSDARAVFQDKLESIDDALYEIEKPTELSK